MKKRVSRIISVAIAATLAGATFSFAASVPTDVKGNSYEPAVTALVEKGIITGDADGNFNPDATLTRAQACIIVVKSMNPPVAEVVATATQPVPKSGFNDMTGYGWAEGYINYAVKHNVTKGYPDGTFKPGNKVTVNELITMVLRASGYSDGNLAGIWPANYVNKATELQLLTNLPAPLPALATKWMAAQLDYNALDKITAANPAPSAQPQGTDKDKPAAVPDTSGLKYANDSFNIAMTTYGGKAISKDVIVYTYGKKANYNSGMSFSKNASDYRLDTVYKFRKATTPAFYSMAGNEINMLILPMDSGFSGHSYGVVNNVVKTLNGEGEAVTALQTLTAAREITWLGDKNLNGIPTSSGAGNGYLDGTVYELEISDGTITKVAKSTDANKYGSDFKEISTAGAVFVKIQDYQNRVVKTADGVIFEVKENASVYVMDVNDKTKYSAGSIGDISKDVWIRAYDMSPDDQTSADVVVIMK